MAEAVQRLREAYPGMGKEKIWKMLEREGVYTPISTVGQILTRQKARGVLREPPRNGIGRRKRRLARPYAARKPKECRVKEPRGLLFGQEDTLDVRPLPGVPFKQSTA